MKRALLVLSASLVILCPGCGRSPSYYLEKGRERFAKQQYAEAAIHFRNAIQRDPQFGEAYYQLGLAELHLSKWREAYQDLSRAAELLPGRDDVKATLGLYRKDPEEFFRLAQAHLEAGGLYGRRQRWDDAIQEYELGAKAHPKEKLLYLKRIADVWLAQGKGERAMQVVAAIRKQQPSDEAAKAVEASLLLAGGKPEKVAEAVSLFQGLVAKSPENPIWRFNLGRAIAAQGDYQGALRYADQILAVNPNLPSVRLLRAVSLVNTGKDADARKELVNLEKVFPDEVQLQSAMLDLKQKKFKEAERGFRKLLEKDPGNARAIAGPAQVYDAQNQVDRAIQEYRRLLAAEPQSAQLHLALGRAYQLKGDLSSAIANFREAAALAPKDPAPPSLLGEVLAASGRQFEAVESFRHALELKPGNVVLMNDLAYLIVESGGSLDEALALAQKALQAAPDQPNVADTLGWVYFKRNMSDSAVQIFQGLARKYPDNPNFRYHLGLALRQKGDNTSAP